MTVQHLDTSGMVNAPSETGSTQPGFTLWPAQSPGTGSFSTDAGGTEYFMSSNAADEATKPISGTAGPRTSNQIVVWTLSNTSSLNSASPALGLSNKVVSVGPVRRPAQGDATGIRQARRRPPCLRASASTMRPPRRSLGSAAGICSSVRRRTTHEPEVVLQLDSNDTRMQQVMYANGKLWGALDSAVTVGGANRAGIAYYIVNPSAGQGRVQRLPRSGRRRPHLPGNRGHGERSRRHGVHVHG